MNKWNFKKSRVLLDNIKKPYISKTAKINFKAEVLGKVFIGENVNIGSSKICSKDENIVNIGKDTVIKDKVVISSKDYHFKFHASEINIVKDIFIGCKVFISSESLIKGPCIIADGVFIGYGTSIINSRIGSNCIIENNVVIKSVDVPAGTFIPSKSMIDSKEKLFELLYSANQYNICELDYKNEDVLSIAG